MEADHNAPSISTDPVGGELEALRTRCRRQQHELVALGETVSVSRRDAHDLGVENARLRSDLGAMRALAHARVPAADAERLEVRLALDPWAPAEAGALVQAFLRDRVPYGILDRATLIVSELVAGSLSATGPAAAEPLIVRVECSPLTVRLEVDEPIATEPGSSVGHVMERFSERWGGERIAAGRLRVWAQLSLAVV